MVLDEISKQLKQCDTKAIVTLSVTYPGVAKAVEKPPQTLPIVVIKHEVYPKKIFFLLF